MRTFILTFLATFAAGFIGGAWWLGVGGATSARVVPTVVGEVRAPTLACADRAAELSNEVEAFEARTAWLHELIDRLQGPPIQPPANNPTRAAVEAWLGDVVALDDEYDGRLDWVNCDDYPCIAAVSFPAPPTLRGTSSRYAKHLGELMVQVPAGDKLYVTRTTYRSADGSRQDVYLTIWAHPPSEREAQRAKFVKSGLRSVVRHNERERTDNAAP